MLFEICGVLSVSMQQNWSKNCAKMVANGICEGVWGLSEAILWSKIVPKLTFDRFGDHFGIHVGTHFGSEIDNVGGRFSRLIFGALFN